MGRKGLSDFMYAPGAGIRNDVEKLLEMFTSKETVRYEHFAEIWREMKMSFIFSGRQNEREVKEFIEEAYKIAFQFYLPPYNFQVRVGALYLLYGLYTTQPLVSKCKIRVLLDQWREVLEFQKEVQNQEHLDVAYVFHKLRVNRAFEFVASSTEVYPTMQSKMPEDSGLNEEFQEEQSVLYDLFSTESLEQLAAVHQHYHRVKVALEGHDASKPSKALDVINDQLVPSITKAVVNYQEKRKNSMNVLKKKGATTESDEEEEEDEYKPFLTEATREGKRSRLKSKAYKKVAINKRSRRHRQVQDEEEQPSPTKKRRGKPKKNKNQDTEVDTDMGVVIDQSKPEVKTEIENNTEVTVLSMPSLDLNPPGETTAGKPQVTAGKRNGKQKATPSLDAEKSEPVKRSTKKKGTDDSKKKVPMPTVKLATEKPIAKPPKKRRLPVASVDLVPEKPIAIPPKKRGRTK